MKHTLYLLGTIAFVMNSALAAAGLKGAQQAGPFVAWAGSYNGLAYDTNQPVNYSSFFFAATLTTKGNVSLKLQMAGRTATCSGSFSDVGTLSANIQRPGLTPLTIHLQLDPGSTDTMSGEITDGTWTASLTAFRGVYNTKSNMAPQTGKYTLYLAGLDASGQPAGHGYATVTVNSAGLIGLSGVLADGTKVAQKALISAGGLWPLYLSLYSGQGSLFGWQTFSNKPTMDIEGAGNWIKLAQPKAKLFPAGFSNEIDVVGCRYNPTNNQPLFNFSSGEVSFSKGNLPKLIVNDVLVGADNRVTNLGTNKLSLALTGSSGVFKGSIINPSNGKPIAFSGVVLQKQNSGFGNFLGTNESGDVTFNSGVNVSPVTLETPLPVGALSLDGLTEDGFNSLFTPLTFSLAGIRFDPDPAQVHLAVNGQAVDPGNLIMGHHSISVNSLLSDGRNEVVFSGLDLAGRPLFLSSVVWAGQNLLQVELQNQDGTAFKEMATVTASMGDDESVFVQKQSSTGAVIFENVPSRTTLISALASKNRSGFIGAVGNAGLVELRILGFDPPSPIANNDFSLGIEGWQTLSSSVQVTAHIEGIPTAMHTAGTSTGNYSRERPRMPVMIQPQTSSYLQRPAQASSDQDLILGTSGEGEQSISRTFSTQPGTSAVRVRYRFITSEVPGGYFGSQYNDYFRVTIRSQNGAQMSEEANSMNGLGLGAFDYASGATDWREVALQVDPSGDIVEVGVAVANVADGLYDSQVVVDFVQEVKDQVRPTLAWNNLAGGINLSFDITGGTLDRDTEIDLYWANGTAYENRIGSPLYSYVVAAGTPPGHYGPFRIDGSQLTDDPDGVTHVIAASSSTSVGALKDVTISYGSSANPSVVWPAMIDIIRDSLRAAGQSTATITSTARTPADQARAMFNNLVHANDTLSDIADNVDIQKNGDGGDFHGYAAPGDAVIDKFVTAIQGMTADQIRANHDSIQAAMEQEIINQGPSNVSRHCADPSVTCVVDVWATPFNNSNGPLFVSAVSGRVTKYIDERSVNHCYHLQLE